MDINQTPASSNQPGSGVTPNQPPMAQAATTAARVAPQPAKKPQAGLYTQPPPQTIPAVNIPHTKGDTKVLIALIAGVLSLSGVLMPIVGIPLAITAFAVGTLSLHSVRRTMALASLILGGLGLLLSIGMFGYMFTSQDQGFKSSLGVLATINSGPEVVVDSACYTITVRGNYIADNDKEYCASKLANEEKGEQIILQAVSNSDDSAKLDAMDACFDIPYDQDAEYQKCIADAAGKKTETVIKDKADLKTEAQKEIDATLKERPSLQILSQKEGTFAGQDAYIVELQEAGKYGYTVYILADKSYDISGSSTNLFIFDYAKTGSKTKLSALSKTVEFK